MLSLPPEYLPGGEEGQEALSSLSCGAHGATPSAEEVSWGSRESWGLAATPTMPLARLQGTLWALVSSSVKWD